MMKNLPTNEQQDNLPARHCWPADPQRVPSQPRIRVAREQVERRIVCRAFHRYISHNRILRRFGLAVTRLTDANRDKLINSLKSTFGWKPPSASSIRTPRR